MIVPATIVMCEPKIGTVCGTACPSQGLVNLFRVATAHTKYERCGNLYFRVADTLADVFGDTVASIIHKVNMICTNF